jgi:hypothetical protein
MAASMKIVVLWDFAMIVLMMEAVSTFETSVNFYETATEQHPRRQSSSTVNISTKRRYVWTEGPGS